jgi:RNA recognition motif. (a.k.a. RRM, RBD, or RNP domain)
MSSGMRGDEGLRRGGVSSRDEHHQLHHHHHHQPSGETASTVAALWGHSSTSPPLPSLSVASHQPGYHDMGLAEGLSLSGRPGARDVGRSVLHGPIQKRAGGGIQVGEHTGYLRMRGLPFSAAKEDIFKFFGGFNPVQESIVLTFRNDGRATGEAYVGFASAEDSERAMALHRRMMGSRYIELFISNKEEHGRAVMRFGSR